MTNETMNPKILLSQGLLQDALQTKGMMRERKDEMHDGKWVKNNR